MPKTDRGLSSGLLGFVAIIVIMALLYTLFSPAITQVTDTSLEQTDNTEATNVINERLTIWENILFFGLMLAGVYIITRAVFESRRPG